MNINDQGDYKHCLLAIYGVSGTLGYTVKLLY